MIWLWRDTADPVRMAEHDQATFWYVLPSLPMFLLIPVLLKRFLLPTRSPIIAPILRRSSYSE